MFFFLNTFCQERNLIQILWQFSLKWKYKNMTDSFHSFNESFCLQGGRDVGRWKAGSHSCVCSQLFLLQISWLTSPHPGRLGSRSSAGLYRVCHLYMSYTEIQISTVQKSNCTRREGMQHPDVFSGGVCSASISLLYQFIRNVIN